MPNTHHISSKQIKAARAILDWSQENLAEASGLSIATIRKIEAGNLSPRPTTNKSLKKAIERAGLEFIHPHGVRQRPEEITVYEGKEGLCSFYDDVYNHARKNGGTIEIVCINEDPTTETLGDYGQIHRDRMSKLVHKAQVKCILTENYEATPAKYCEYRSISKAYIDSVPFYIYGNNYAIILFDANPSPKIIIHHSPLLAEAYRKQFYSMWDKAMLVYLPDHLAI